MRGMAMTVARGAVAVAALLTGAVAFGAEGGGDDVPGYIMHHVSDSPEYEFEIPLGRPGGNPVIHLPVIRIPISGAGCPADIHAHAPLTECLDLSITKHTVMMWIAAALLLLVMFLFPHRNKKELVAKGKAANFIELLVVFVRDEIAIKNIGKEYGPRYTPYLLSAFFFILFMNLLGLFPWMATATANLAVTLAMALCTFFLTQYASIKAAGIGAYLKHLTGGVHFALWPIMIPVEILGLFTKPFALTVRLFANMLAGHVVIFFLLGLIFILQHPAVAIISVPLALAIYFLELFVAFVQAYIFTMLSALFIGMGVAVAHHDDHGHGAQDGHADHHKEGAHSHDHGKAHA
ncbi:MAG: F0F1 ATP synthase subunit A [Myxococcota bacterium]|nr:F0F1 ATP synthase subunit A [Myxococcota bacterium]